MTATTYAAVRARRIMTALMTVIAPVGLAATLMFGFTPTSNASPLKDTTLVSHQVLDASSSRSTLCGLLANATPGSPAAFRLAENIADSGATCAATPDPRPTNPPLCGLLAYATPGSPAAFRLAQTIADAGGSCDFPAVAHRALDLAKLRSILCGLLANATPGSPAAFRLVEMIYGSGTVC